MSPDVALDSTIDTAPPTRGRSWLPLVAAGITMVLWASAFVVIRALSGAVDSGPLALGRLLVGSVVLTGVAVLRPGRGPLRITRGRPLVLIIAYGVLWFGVYTIAVNAAGHTPGHTAFAVASGAARLLVMSDTANHPAVFVRHPDWSAVFDMDADAARATRRRILDMAATERMQVAFYHAPFPATGYVAREGAGFRMVPVAWQPNV